MKQRRTTAITHEGWYYLFIFAMIFGGALLRDVNLLVILGGMLAGPLLLSRHLGLQTLRGLTVQRRLPKAVCAGDLLIVNLSITNPRKYLGSWVLVLHDPIRRLNGGKEKRRKPPMQEPDVLFSFVPARQTCKGVYRGRLTQRGRYRLGPMRLSTRFPFGLFRYSISCGSSTTLMVLPRLGKLARDWKTRRHESFAGADRREQRPGIEGDFYGLRPWQRGDSRRWIHWRTSARAGELMVRQFEQPRNRDVAVLLDLWQPGTPTAEEGDNVELAVSCAATLVAELCRAGSSEVFLIAADPEPRVSGGPGSAALLQEMMERLALVEAQSRDRAVDLLQQAAGRIDPGTEIVLVSTRAVDLGNPDDAGKLPAEIRRRMNGKRIRVVDTSSNELAKFFQVEE